MNFVLEQIRTGGDRNFSYLVGDRAAGLAVAVDPSYKPELIHERARAQGLSITHIFCTHSHVDHTSGNQELKQLTGARICAHRTSPLEPDVPLEEGQTIPVGAISIHMLHVPGHCPDHMLFHLPQHKVALTGDHLFVGKVGGTSTEADATEEFESLHRTLSVLPDETTIWPGHDYGCRPSSTIAIERISNPFLQSHDLRAFLELKANWARFKADHGLI